MSRSDSNRVDSADLTCRTHMAKPRPLANERTEYGPSLVLSPAIYMYVCIYIYVYVCIYMYMYI